MSMSTYFIPVFSLIVIAFLIFSPLAFAEEELLRTRRPGAEQLGYYPENNELVRVNPPYFLWIPEKNALKYEVELSEREDFDTKEVFSDISHSILLLHKPLKLGHTYYWRFRYIDTDGEASFYSQIRKFTISKTATEFFIPPLKDIKEKIGSHPRLFVTPNNIEEMRAKREDVIGEILWQSIYWDGKKVTSIKPPKEPEDFPGGVWEVNHWSAMLDRTLKAVQPLETGAFVYLITGERDIGQSAKEWLLEIAKWDPKGPTSAAINDECSMNILFSLSRAYTWLYDLLSEQEKNIVEDSLRQRGEEVYNLLTEKGKEYHIRPYTSHSGRQIAFLGEAAIALLGEIEEADKWFDYVTQVFFSIYPAWGKEDGGWAEGPIYWRWYMERILWFADAFYQSTGVSLLDKPFFQNTGYFKLYVQPPFSKHSPFGDNLDERPNIEDYTVMSYLAKYTDNPYFKWYAKQLKGMIPRGIMGFMWYGDSLDSNEPTDLPQSLYFRDVGWVSMHTNLSDEDSDIHVLFKSSPYGSYSHSHADQNAFTLEAFGSPLIISSGYYPFYGSPHHTQWTRQSLSKATILVNGMGQPIQAITAKGEIKDFVSTEGLDYTLGDATKAYAGSLKQYDREIIFIKPYFVFIHDKVAARKESTFDWLLHAREEFLIDGNAFKIIDGGAKLSGEIRSSLPLKLSTHNKFTVDPEERHATKPKQWHFTAHTTEKNTEAEFLAILLPQTKADTANYEALWEEHAAAIIYKDTKTTLLFGEEAFGLTTDGKTTAVSKCETQLISLLLADGSFVKDNSNTLLKLSRKGTVALSILDGEVSVNRDLKEEGLTITLKLSKAPKKVSRDRKEISTWIYDNKTELLTITLE